MKKLDLKLLVEIKLVEIKFIILYARNKNK